MNLTAKLALAIATVAVPATVIIVHADPRAGRNPTALAAASERPKDNSRVVSTTSDDKASLLIQLARMSRQPKDIRVADAFMPPPPPPFGPPPQPHGPGEWHAPPAGMGPPPPGPAPMMQSACEDRIDRQVAFAAFMKSRLRLQPSQLEAWQKLEQAAAPALAKIQAACDQLPAAGHAPPPLPDMIDAMEAQMSARTALLKIVQQPLRDLFDTLSPEQRAKLRPPPPPPFRRW